MIFKIVTWNINSIKIRLPHLLELITLHQPDIICLQELKCTNEQFPRAEFDSLPYNLYIHGQKTYNGVAILSRIPADDINTDFPDNPLARQSRFMEVTFYTSVGFNRIISLYAPNGGTVDSENFSLKLQFYDAFTSYLESIKSFNENIFICGDYNIAPFSTDVYNPGKMADSTCFTLAERKKLRTILNSGFIDNYRLKHPDKQEFSWWDYRAGAFEQNQGMRIDTIISNSYGTKYLSDCFIDYQSRAKARPSDHAPVIAVYQS